MDSMMEMINALFDILFFDLVSPLFGLLGKGLELILLRPLQLLQLPPALQITVLAAFCALFSLYLRKVMHVEKKENDFRRRFLAKKEQQESLHLISDWKSREKFAKAMDDDIDEDFNTYLAGRFARYGLVYLLPVFLTLYWLENIFVQSPVITLPENSTGLTDIPYQAIFLATYCLTLFTVFTIRKKCRSMDAKTALSI